ncbi:MAG TPA: type II TA system antitoxin MqsA family protein [Clostridia bacterium]|nr:type II TA system antitoxin MqsA family protein [Clostridia bacterium]
MNQDYLIETIEMDCPICNKEHSLEMRKRQTQAILKGEKVDYEEVYYLCPISDEDENEFVPASLMDENLLRVRDAYRMKKGLLTSEEIIKIREFYGLTQSDFSALLGWGEVTINRYESKAIQDETYDNIMRMVYQNPMFAMEFLEKHKERFSESKYNSIRKNIVNKVGENGNTYIKMQEIKSLYVSYEDLSDYNGYKILDITKLASAMGYFAEFTNNLYKVKLMKLLWYTDALYFRRYGQSMTGLVYKHMTYGALPVGFDEILDLPTIKVVEEMIYEDISYKIYPSKQVNISDFSLDELNVLELVANTFKDYKAREIVDYMHKEKAYIETENFQIIPYSLAKELSQLA